MGPFYDEAQGEAADARVRLRDARGRRPRLAAGRALTAAGRPSSSCRRSSGCVEAGTLVVCVGGGGIPTLRARDGSLSGTAAVIDKDLAAARLALDLDADVLLILTDVANAFIDYRGPGQRALEEVTVAEMEAYVAEGHFKAGSMGPKVEAALRVAREGKTGIIASLTETLQAVEGRAGTRIVGAECRSGHGCDGAPPAATRPGRPGAAIAASPKPGADAAP